MPDRLLNMHSWRIFSYFPGFMDICHCPLWKITSQLISGKHKLHTSAWPVHGHAHTSHGPPYVPHAVLPCGTTWFLIPSSLLCMRAPFDRDCHLCACVLKEHSAVCFCLYVSWGYCLSGLLKHKSKTLLHAYWNLWSMAVWPCKVTFDKTFHLASIRWVSDVQCVTNMMKEWDNELWKNF